MGDSVETAMTGGGAMRLGLPALRLVFVYGAFQLGKAAGLVLYLLAISGGANI